MGIILYLTWGGRGLFLKSFVEYLLYLEMDLAMDDRHINRSSYLPGRPFLERSIKHYSNFHQILLVGEGDFSFSSALANAFGSTENMVTTSLDSRGLKHFLKFFCFFLLLFFLCI